MIWIIENGVSSLLLWDFGLGEMTRGFPCELSMVFVVISRDLDLAGEFYVVMVDDILGV